jgi:hypothetical protein
MELTTNIIFDANQFSQVAGWTCALIYAFR